MVYSEATLALTARPPVYAWHKKAYAGSRRERRWSRILRPGHPPDFFAVRGPFWDLTRLFPRTNTKVALLP